MFQLSCGFACCHVIVFQTGYRKQRVHAVRFSQLLSAPFLVALETQIFVNNLQNWWSTDPSPAHVKFHWLFGGSEVCLSDSATATQLCRRFYQYVHCVCRCPDACRLFRTSPAAWWCCFSSSLCSETLLWTAKRSDLHTLADFWLKFFLLYWAPERHQSCRVCLVQCQNLRYFRCPIWKTKSW